jgi:mono/diheme cytochrome c family protein
MSSEPRSPAAPPPELAPPEETQEEVDIQRMHAPILREQDEPREGFEPINPALTIAFGLIVFGCGYYLATYSGDFRGDVLNENRGEPAAAQPAKPVDPVVLGQRLFNGKCVACHQPDGKGRPGQFPPLAGSEWLLGPPEIPVRILLFGLSGDVTVAGQHFNGNMPAFGEQLKDEQIAAVLSYVRQEWGNHAAPIPTELVTQLRKTDQRKQPWTAEALKAAPAAK